MFISAQRPEVLVVLQKHLGLRCRCLVSVVFSCVFCRRSSGCWSVGLPDGRGGLRLPEAAGRAGVHGRGDPGFLQRTGEDRPGTSGTLRVRLHGPAQSWSASFRSLTSRFLVTSSSWPATPWPSLPRWFLFPSLIVFIKIFNETLWSAERHRSTPLVPDARRERVDFNTFVLPCDRLFVSTGS